MGQLFKDRANAIARLIIFGGPALLFTVGASLYFFERSDFWTRVGEPLNQPVPFSHKHHVEGLGIDCRYVTPRLNNRRSRVCRRRKLA
jgi:hypothetical protein